MSNQKRAYKINGTEYESFGQLPDEYKKLLTPEILEQLHIHKGGSANFRSVLASPHPEQKLELKAIKWIVYLAGQIMSFVENRALSVIASALNIVQDNLYLSLLVSLLIGQVSYMLAQRYYQKRSNVNIFYNEDISFLKNFEIAQISSECSFLINLLYFIALFLIKTFFV